MGKLSRVKDAIFNTEIKLREDIENLHREGQRPADYSLGFTNGVIFCCHHLKLFPGRPKFYDQTTSVGVLPMPVKFKHQEEEETLDAAEFDTKVQNIIDAAKDIILEGSTSRPALVQALQEYENFLASKEIPPGAATPGVEEVAPSQIDQPKVCGSEAQP